MKNNLRSADSKARVVLYRWSKDGSERSLLRMKEIADQYEEQKKAFGWITVASIKDVCNYHTVDRSGIKKIMYLALAGKVDAIYTSGKDQLFPFMFEILKFYKILSENGVELLNQDE